jgi:hypothetical protein
MAIINFVLLVLGLLPPVALNAQAGQAAPSAQTGQAPPRLIKMFNSATIPLKIGLYPAKGNKTTITIKGRDTVTISSDSVRAEICTKGRPCSSRRLRKYHIYSIVEDPQTKIWTIVELEDE